MFTIFLLRYRFSILFTVDETPTPTRFIRNCDEIGLFQELQHNPFEETFRIAIESSSNDLSNVIKVDFASSKTPSLFSIVSFFISETTF